MRSINKETNSLKLVQNDNMSATGVPPHILHNIRMEKMESKIETLNDKICEQLDNLQNECRTSLPRTVANTVITEISSNLVVNGAVPVTMRDFDAKFELVLQEIKKASAVSAQNWYVNYYYYFT